jgi:SAM-dependent methyltransferase
MVLTKFEPSRIRRKEDSVRMTSSVDLSEDLAALAQYGFRVAQTSCTSCHEYHALWGFERLSRVKRNSFHTESDLLIPLLRNHLPVCGNLLIAGVADAGLLAFVTQTTRDLKPRITVADRCATPLAVCRRYADTHNLPIDTVLVDLTKTPSRSNYHLVFGHNILMLQPANLHAGFFGNIRDSLAPGGIFLLVHRVRPPNAKASHLPPKHYASSILDALANNGVTIPESEVAFRRRLEAYAEFQHDWSDAVIDRSHVEDALAAAGLEIVERIDHERRRTIPDRDGGQAAPMPTHIFVSRPRT